MWIELFKNTNGKFSSSGFIGVILGIVAALSFVAAMVGYFLELPNTVEVMGEMLKLVAASTVLLGVRKITPRIGRKKYDDEGEDKIDINDEQIVDSKRG
jgi:zinc transporter ZupT